MVKSIGFVNSENVRDFAFFCFKKGVEDTDRANYDTIASFVDRSHTRTVPTEWLFDGSKTKELMYGLLGSYLFGLENLIMVDETYAKFKHDGMIFEMSPYTLFVYSENSRHSSQVEFKEREYKAYGQSWDISVKNKFGRYLDHQLTMYMKETSAIAVTFEAIRWVKEGLYNA